MRLIFAALVVVAVACSADDPLPMFNMPEEQASTATTTTSKNTTTTTTTTTAAPTTTSTTTTSTTTTSTTTTAAVGYYRGTVEVWRSEVESAVAHWGGDTDDVTRFLRIMECESGGDPLAKNPNSSASGLMQHLTRFWDERAAAAGMPDGDVFDGRTNIYVSAWLALAAPGGGWQHWVCR